MARERIVDFSDPKEKALVVSEVQLLKGVHRVSMLKHRPRRSDRQNKYYWPCFVQVFADWLREQGEVVTDDEVHEMFKGRFLRRTMSDRLTGEVIGDYTRSTTDLNVHEFNQYLDHLRAFLGETFGIQVPDPSMYHEVESEQLIETEG